ncbi:exopolysaccharide biosynthesis protein [Roseivivax sediminis]|uniref:Uncharacterized conserved protein n=1 Tax=Roseivivax sediminis TaxID=936889 RepID=A0A1I1VFS0_9RHOB|nr:exopolysaccharide biosynthesis protein [Roseivivax sediminis]SFD81635.1 Uncharacterized conserved protein [Roseivivax sediminis]
MKKREGALTDVIDELVSASEGRDVVEVGELIDALDQRGYGPALAILPLLELTPIGGIPGFPTLLAVTLGLITVRLLMGYDHFWAPGWLRRRSFDSRRVIASVNWLKPVSLRIDAQLHERLAWLAGPSGRRAACVVILCILVTVPPLEVVPFATSGPMIAVSVFGLGLLYRDGLLMLMGFAGAAAAVTAGLWAFLLWSGAQG